MRGASPRPHTRHLSLPCNRAAPTCTTPPGLTPIIMQMPRKAESFSSLSRMFLSEVHLQGGRDSLQGTGDPPCHPCPVRVLGPHHSSSSGNLPRPDELLEHWGHFLGAHVAQAADGDGWNGRGTRQATCKPERPRDGTWRGLGFGAPAHTHTPSRNPRGSNRSCWAPLWGPMEWFPSNPVQQYT